MSTLLNIFLKDHLNWVQKMWIFQVLIEGSSYLLVTSCFTTNVWLNNNFFENLRNIGNTIYEMLPNPEEGNLELSCVSAIYQTETYTERNSALLKFVQSFLETPFYTQLREKQNLGYSVYSVTVIDPENELQYIHFQIQGKESPTFVDEKIQEFVRSFYVSS